MTEDPLHWPEDRLLTRAEASAYARALGLRLAVSTLAKHAWRGDGPLLTYFNRRPYVRLGDLREWLAQRTRRSRCSRPPEHVRASPQKKTQHD